MSKILDYQSDMGKTIQDGETVDIKPSVTEKVKCLRNSKSFAVYQMEERQSDPKKTSKIEKLPPKVKNG